mgnify:CR=1 FL=1
MSNVDHQVSIGSRFNVVFNSKAEKDSYLEHEMAYTRNELEALYRAIKTDERRVAKEKLIEKRREFYEAMKKEGAYGLRGKLVTV